MVLDDILVNGNFLAQKWYFSQIFLFLAYFCYFLAFFRKIFMKYIESDVSSSLKQLLPFENGPTFPQAHLVRLLWDKTCPGKMVPIP